MSALFENISWYQDPNYVTGSVKILDKSLKNYVAEFNEDSFHVLVDGKYFYCLCVCFMFLLYVHLVEIYLNDYMGRIALK